MDEFLTRFLDMPRGYVRGTWEGRPHGVRVEVSGDGRRRKLYAEALDGDGHVSCNLYLPDGGAPLVRPCEMPEERVRAFVLEFRPDA